MSVLTLTGKAINWDNPPKASARVKWSQPTSGGKPVTGSLRTIAHLDHLDNLARKKFGSGIVVIQPPYNTTVKESAGTHDFDACLDLHIPGVDWRTQERFLRANGFACWWRRPPAFGHHIHGFTLPPQEGLSVSDDFSVAGFKVGRYVDGGYSLFGSMVASSQISDYYSHRTGLAGHGPDDGWFPANIKATIFDLDAYISRQWVASKGSDEVVNISSHGPLARLGGAAGQDLWDEWEGSVRKRANTAVRSGRTVFIISDTNKRDGLPNFGRALRRIGGRGIDLIALRQANGGAVVKVLKRKVVPLRIDGHDGHGAKVRVTFPSGKKVTYWLVQANLGRGVSADVFRESCIALRKAFGKNAVYNFNEIDEADRPPEHDIVAEVFPESQFAASGWNSRVPTLVGRRKLRVIRKSAVAASPGLAKVSPRRMVIETSIGPK
jgi:hypothetical protein